jgi:hypothetical protein
MPLFLTSYLPLFPIILENTKEKKRVGFTVDFQSATCVL